MIKGRHDPQNFFEGEYILTLFLHLSRLEICEQERHKGRHITLDKLKVDNSVYIILSFY